jgi:hypothetical protein
MSYAEKAQAHRQEHLARAERTEEFARRFYADDPDSREMVERMARWDRRRARKPYWLVVIEKAPGHWSAPLLWAAFLWIYYWASGALDSWFIWCLGIVVTALLVAMSVVLRRVALKRRPGAEKR